MNAASAAALARTLARDRDQALLFRELATLRADLPVFDWVEELRWTGPTAGFARFAARFDAAVTGPDRRKR